MDISRYIVEGNGKATMIESVALHEHHQTITSGLPEGTDTAEDRLIVRWRDLRDVRNRVIEDPVRTLSIQ